MHCALNYTANPVKIDLHKYISDNRQLRISAGACVAITLRKEVGQPTLEIDEILSHRNKFCTHVLGANSLTQIKELRMFKRF